VLLDPVRLASRNLSPAGLVPMLQQANKQYSAGNLTSDNHEIIVETGAFLQTAEDVGNVVVGVYSGKPVYLRDGGDHRGWRRKNRANTFSLAPARRINFQPTNLP